MKATDEQLVSLYEELSSVWKVAEKVGMCGQSVHERLVKLGISNAKNLLTKEDEDRLIREYTIFRDAGKLEVLAEQMGRTKHYLCRKARALGLTDQKAKRTYISVWKYISDEAADAIWADFKRSSFGLGAYCRKRGYDDLGFSKAMKEHFRDEYELIIEIKQPRSTAYRRGRSFEYTTRDALKKIGYFVMRSPASKSPIDLVAVAHGRVLFIQCKLSGHIGVEEWNKVFDIAASVGAVPIMTERPNSGRGVAYWRMTDRKDGSKRPQPMVKFDPSLEELS